MEGGLGASRPEGAVGAAVDPRHRCTAATWWPSAGERRARPRAGRSRIGPKGRRPTQQRLLPCQHFF